jgi:hypothetical protein
MPQFIIIGGNVPEEKLELIREIRKSSVISLEQIVEIVGEENVQVRNTDPRSGYDILETEAQIRLMNIFRKESMDIGEELIEEMKNCRSFKQSKRQKFISPSWNFRR